MVSFAARVYTLQRMIQCATALTLASTRRSRPCNLAFSPTCPGLKIRFRIASSQRSPSRSSTAKPWGSRVPGLRSTISRDMASAPRLWCCWGPWPRKPGPCGWGPPSWCRRYTTRFAWPKTLPWSMSSATGASMSVLGAAAPGTSTMAMASTATRVSNAFRKVSA